MNIDIKNLSVKFNNEYVLKNLSLEIKPKSYVCITGHNGAGKSTLIKSILKEIPVSKSKIFLDNTDINDFNNFSNIGYVPQNLKFINFEFPITVFEFLICFSKNKNKEHINSLLKDLNIIHLRDKDINDLSGGEQRRVFVTRSILNDISLLILDEPNIGIDKKNEQIIYKFLQKLNKKGITILIITHNYEDVAKYATHHINMDLDDVFIGEVA